MSEAFPSLASKLPPPWTHIAGEDWADWRWQMRNRVRTSTELSQFLELTSAERQALDAQGSLFRVDITPYFASLMDRSDPHCPLRRQVIPTPDEMRTYPADCRDPLSEDRDSPPEAPGIMHRYPDRVALMITSECAAYCRFCTRSRMVGKPMANGLATGLDLGLRYIREHTEIRDVLLTGGDPLLVADETLDRLLARIRAIPHVEIVRLSTRLPVFLPYRITPSLVNVLRRHHPLWINVNVNHPGELTEECSKALALLADGGIPLGSQTVLMAGINDCPNVMRDLFHKLMRCRVRPYYLYQCDPTIGVGHFRTPVSKGIEIIESLRGHTSGLAVPTFVIDAPHGGGKTPVGPNYVVSSSDRTIVLRTFAGTITAYPETDSYTPHDAKSCSSCLDRRQSHPMGVASLFDPLSPPLSPKEAPDRAPGILPQPRP